MEEEIKMILELSGTDMKMVEFKEVKDNSLTLRYGYWKWLPSKIAEKLLALLKDKFEVTLDTFVDEDDYDGKPFYRYLHSYKIKRK